LIAAGHPPREVMEYTPRQIQAFGFIAERRRKGDLAWTLVVSRVAAHGDEKDNRAQLKELQDG
jgi:hypothetical protein